VEERSLQQDFFQRIVYGLYNSVRSGGLSTRGLAAVISVFGWCNEAFDHVAKEALEIARELDSTQAGLAYHVALTKVRARWILFAFFVRELLRSSHCSPLSPL
jgi:hypothetical protein